MPKINNQNNKVSRLEQSYSSLRGFLDSEFTGTCRKTNKSPKKGLNQQTCQL